MQSRPGESRQGLFYALGAYGIWGLVMPIFMKLLAHVSPVEVVAHRIVWALPLAIAILLWQGTVRQAFGHFRNLRTLALAALTAKAECRLGGNARSVREPAPSCNQKQDEADE